MKNFIAALTLRFVDRLSGPARGATSAIGQINRAQEMGKAAASKWSQGLEELDGKLNRLASASLVTDGLDRAGEAMMRPLKAGVTAAAEFGQGMTGIGITAEMTDQQLQPLRATILETAREIGALPGTVQATFGAVLAEGVYKTDAELSRAGQSVARFQRLMAGMGENLSDEEAGAYSAAMGASLKMRADQLDRANAMVVRSAKQGGVSGAVLAKALPAQTGALRGLSFANNVGLADLLSANQIAKRLAGSSDQATNNVTNLFAALASPETIKNFGKIGVNLEAEIKAGVTKGVSPLETLAALVKEKTGGDQFRIGELFGDRQARDAMVALVQNIDDFRTMSRELKDEGALPAYFADLDRAAKGPAASFGRYQSNISALGIATGSILAPAVGVAADLLGRVATWMAKAGENGSFLAKAAVWAVAGLAGIAVGAGAVGHAVVGILGPLFIAKTLLGPGGLGGAAFQGASAKVIGLFGRMRLAALSFNLTMLANPVGLAVVGVIAAVALIAVVVRKYWEPIKAFFSGVGQALGEAFGPALGEIGAALRPLKPLWDGVSGAVGAFFGWVGRLLQPMKATESQLEGATGAGRRFGRMFAVAFSLTPVGLFARGIMGAFRFIRGAMNWRPVETLRGAWSTVSGFFTGMATRFNGFGRMIMQGLVAGVRAMLGEVAGAVVGVANGAVARFKGVLGIRSPSRVFAALGGWTMAGLSQGLGLGGRDAVRQAGMVGAAVIAAMPTPGAALPEVARGPAPVAAGVNVRSGAGAQINSVTINVTVQGGSGDPRALGRQIGRDAAEALRRALHDEG